MLRRFLPGAALLCLVILPAVAQPAPAPNDKTAQPTVVLRMQSIDELLTNARYLATLADQEEYVKQLEGFIKSMTGPNGLEGIDTKRPIAMYGNLGPNGVDSTGVVLVPITSEKAVLDLLDRMQVKIEKGNEGLYTVKDDNLPVPVYFRFANKCAYITAMDENAIAKDKLLAPEKVAVMVPNEVLAASFNLGGIPADLRNLAIAQMESQFADAKKQRDPNETDAQFKFKGQVIDAMGEYIIALLKDGEHITLSFNIDRKAHDISFDLRVAGKEDTKLAGSILQLAKQKSVVAGLIGKDSTMSLVAVAALPEELRKGLAPVLEEVIKMGLEQEQDKAKRELGAKVAKVLEPTLKAAEVDMALDMRGPSAKNLYTLVAGLKVKDGTDIDKMVRDLVKELPPAEKAKVKLDADTAGTVKIHRLDVQQDFDEETKKSFGDNPAYIAFRNDAVFLTMGENGLSAIKEALAAAPKVAAPMRMEISMARLAKAMAVTTKDAPKFAEEAFGKKGENDKVYMALEGGQALRLRFGLKSPVIKFLVKVGEAQAGGQK